MRSTLRSADRCPRLISIVACLGIVLGVVAPARADVPPRIRGTWAVSAIEAPTYGSAFSRLVVKIKRAKVNRNAGSFKFYAAGGKTTCRARLTYLGTPPSTSGQSDSVFAVRFRSGASKRARAFCRPSRSNGMRLRINVGSERETGYVTIRPLSAAPFDPNDFTALRIHRVR